MEVEVLNRDFQWSSSHALKQCKRKPNLDYLKQIAELHAEKQILNILFLNLAHESI